MVVASVAWCVALVALRICIARQGYFAFLVYNLLLASLPLVFAFSFATIDRARWATRAACFAGWFLFFPNAPYMLTDLMHLGRKPGAPLWFDLLLLLSFAFVALALGFCSLAIVQKRIAARLTPGIAWLMSVGMLFLSAFGIFLGRFLRWNSWDVVARPFALLTAIGDSMFNPAENAKTWGFTLGFGMLLTLMYMALRVLANPATMRPVGNSSSRQSSAEPA
jgi:uncharacterized membrane protein